MHISGTLLADQGQEVPPRGSAQDGSQDQRTDGMPRTSVGNGVDAGDTIGTCAQLAY